VQEEIKRRWKMEPMVTNPYLVNAILFGGTLAAFLLPKYIPDIFKRIIRQNNGKTRKTEN
jgi:hypothetical protein